MVCSASVFPRSLPSPLRFSLSAIIANALIGVLVGRSIAGLAQLVVYLALIGKYYETDWLKAGVIAVVNTVLGWVILWVLITFVGIGVIF